MKKIRILFLIDYLYGFGGTERHLFELTTRLNPQRFDAIVCPLRCNDEMVSIFENAGVKIYPRRLKKIYDFAGLKQAWKLYRFIRQNDIAVVQTFNRDSDIFGTVVGKLAGVGAIISARRDLGTYRRKRHLLLANVINRYVDHFITVCDAVAQNLIEQEHVSRNKITTIYNGFDAADVTSATQQKDGALSKKLQLNEDSFVVGNVAHFRPEKGHDIFFEAMRQVRDQIPELRVVAVGGGEPLFSRYRHDISQNGLSDFITLTGYVPNVLKHVELMDVCCLTPVSNEGFSNALLEQMALGKAVVATDMGGNREAITDGKSGLIIPPNNPGALAEAILKLYRDKSLREKLGQQARKRVEKDFTMQKMIKELETFYLDLLKN